MSAKQIKAHPVYKYILDVALGQTEDLSRPYEQDLQNLEGRAVRLEEENTVLNEREEQVTASAKQAYDKLTTDERFSLQGEQADVLAKAKDEYLKRVAELNNARVEYKQRLAEARKAKQQTKLEIKGARSQQVRATRQQLVASAKEIDAERKALDAFAKSQEELQSAIDALQAWYDDFQKSFSLKGEREQVAGESERIQVLLEEAQARKEERKEILEQRKRGRGRPHKLIGESEREALRQMLDQDQVSQSELLAAMGKKRPQRRPSFSSYGEEEKAPGHRRYELETEFADPEESYNKDPQKYIHVGANELENLVNTVRVQRDAGQGYLQLVEQQLFNIVGQYNETYNDKVSYNPRGNDLKEREALVQRISDLENQKQKKELASLLGMHAFVVQIKTSVGHKISAAQQIERATQAAAKQYDLLMGDPASREEPEKKVRERKIEPPKEEQE